jgi:hypothetical protein
VSGVRTLIVIAAIVAAGLVGLAVGASIGPRSTLSPASPTAAQTPGASASPHYQGPEDLKVGDCFDPIEDKDDDDLLAAVLTPCDQPHRMEAFGALTHPATEGAPYPGDEPLGSYADEKCAEAFKAYVGTDFDSSSLSGAYFLPNERQWRGGDRQILCVVDVPPSATLNRSVKGSRQ